MRLKYVFNVTADNTLIEQLVVNQTSHTISLFAPTSCLHGTYIWMHIHPHSLQYWHMDGVLCFVSVHIKY